MFAHRALISATSRSVAPLIALVCFAHGWRIGGFLWSVLYLAIACGLAWNVSRHRAARRAAAIEL
jgi:hypothetical protein